MRLALFLIAPVLCAQSIVSTRAGALLCAAVRRASDQVQTYCYAPGNDLVHNTINRVYLSLVMTYNWCATVPPAALTCTPSGIVWKFSMVPEGIAYEITADATTIHKGVLTSIYSPGTQQVGALGASGKCSAFTSHHLSVFEPPRWDDMGVMISKPATLVNDLAFNCALKK